MKLNNSTTLTKIKAEIQSLKRAEYECLMNNDFNGASEIVKDLHKLKKELLTTLDIYDI